MALTAQQIRNAALDTSSTSELVAVLMVQHARTVFAESGATPNHAERVAYARQVCASPVGEAQKWAWLLFTDPAITAPVDTSEITAAITAAWNVMAGV